MRPAAMSGIRSPFYDVRIINDLSAHARRPRRRAERKSSFVQYGSDPAVVITLRPAPLRRRQAINRASCLVPECGGISQADPAFREGLWARYFTAAPRPRTPSELRYSDRRLRSRN